MPVTVYRSTDGSAPVFNQSAGSLVVLLDAVLVNGYGAKAAAGWTKQFTAAGGEAVYKMAAGGSDAVLVVKDTAVANVYNDGTNRLLAAKSATSTVAYTKPFTFPNVGAAIQSQIIHKPDIGTAGSDWIMIANNHFFYLFTRRSGWTTNGIQHTYWSLFFFGDALPLIATDGVKAIIGGSTSGDTSTVNTTVPQNTYQFPNAFFYTTIAQNGSLVASGGPIQGFENGGISMWYRFPFDTTYYTNAINLPYNDPHVRGPIFVPVYLSMQNSPQSYFVEIPRYRMPGLYRNLLAVEGATQGSQVNSLWPVSKDDSDFVFSAGDLSGKTLKNLHLSGDGRQTPNVSSSWGIETTDGWGN